MVGSRRSSLTRFMALSNYSQSQSQSPSHTPTRQGSCLDAQSEPALDLSVTFGPMSVVDSEKHAQEYGSGSYEKLCDTWRPGTRVVTRCALADEGGGVVEEGATGRVWKIDQETNLLIVILDFVPGTRKKVTKHLHAEASDLTHDGFIAIGTQIICPAMKLANDDGTVLQVPRGAQGRVMAVYEATSKYCVEFVTGALVGEREIPAHVVQPVVVVTRPFTPPPPPLIGSISAAVLPVALGSPPIHRREQPLPRCSPADPPSFLQRCARRLPTCIKRCLPMERAEAAEGLAESRARLEETWEVGDSIVPVEAISSPNETPHTVSLASYSEPPSTPRRAALRSALKNRSRVASLPPDTEDATGAIACSPLSFPSTPRRHPLGGTMSSPRLRPGMGLVHTCGQNSPGPRGLIMTKRLPEDWEHTTGDLPKCMSSSSSYQKSNQ